MDEHFAYVPITNSKVLCVGSITAAEAAAAREGGRDLDGIGYYLFLADEDSPTSPIEILAKFVSESEAERVARLFAAKSGN